MLELVYLEQYIAEDTTPYQPEVKELVLPGGRVIETCAIQLFPAEDWKLLDQDLRLLICVCLAREETNRPDLKMLADLVLHRIRERDFLWYCNNGHPMPETEMDEYIEHVLHSCTKDAPEV